MNYALSGIYVGPHRKNESHCAGCTTRFTAIKWQHHCRACGKAYCASCLGDRKLPLRPVCDIWKREREEYWSHTASSVVPLECTADAPSEVWPDEPQVSIMHRVQPDRLDSCKGRAGRKKHDCMTEWNAACAWLLVVRVSESACGRRSLVPAALIE